MTDQDDIIRDLVQRAHAAEVRPAFDIEAGASDVLARAEVLHHTAAEPVISQAPASDARSSLSAGRPEMPMGEHLAWVVIDIEGWGGRPGLAQSRMQDALREIIARAMSASSIAEVAVRRTSRGDGVILGIPSEVTKETITRGFLKGLNRELRLYDDECPPEEVMRLRISLHAGYAQEEGEGWAGNSVVVACRLVDSEILHRVLEAASSAVFAIIVSDVWYDAVLRERWSDPTGYVQVAPRVKDYHGGAWIKVPGFSHPPGLLPSDTPQKHHEQHDEGSPAQRPDRVSSGSSIAVYGPIHGDTVTGNKYGDSLYGSRRQDRL